MNEKIISVKNGQLHINYPEKIFTVLINYHKIVRKMFKIGKFYVTGGDAVFKKLLDFGSSEARVDMKVINFGKCITSINAVKEIRNQGFRSAMVGELFAFCEQYPRILKTDLMVALGSYHFGDDLRRYVHYFDSNNLDGKLQLSWFDDDWSKNHSFLAVAN